MYWSMYLIRSLINNLPKANRNQKNRKKKYPKKYIKVLKNTRKWKKMKYVVRKEIKILTILRIIENSTIR